MLAHVHIDQIIYWHQLWAFDMMAAKQVAQNPVLELGFIFPPKLAQYSRNINTQHQILPLLGNADHRRATWVLQLPDNICVYCEETLILKILASVVLLVFKYYNDVVKCALKTTETTATMCLVILFS